LEQLQDAIARSFDGSSDPVEETVEAMDRRGQRFECHVRVLPLQTRAGDVYASMILAASPAAA
jgi:hypothetical protein